MAGQPLGIVVTGTTARGVPPATLRGTGTAKMRWNPSASGYSPSRSPPAPPQAAPSAPVYALRGVWWAGPAEVLLAGHQELRSWSGTSTVPPGGQARSSSCNGFATVAAATVTAGGRAWHYVVRAVRAYDKARLPSAAVFGQRVTPRLVIITCGGPFDAATGHYIDNIVVYAVPVSPSAGGASGHRDP